MKNFTTKFFEKVPKPVLIGSLVPATSDYYDEDYYTKPGVKGWYDKGAFDLRNMFHCLWTAFCIDILHIKKRSVVLDVGCALGNVVYWMEKAGMHANGFDLSKWAVDSCHEEVKGKVGWGNAAEEWPYPKSTFDFVVSRETVEHISQDGLVIFFEELRRVLKSGGKALIGFANNREDKEEKKQMGEEHDVSHVTIAPLWWWCRMAEKAGLVVDYRWIVYAISQPVCQKYDWDLLVLKKKR